MPKNRIALATLFVMLACTAWAAPRIYPGAKAKPPVFDASAKEIFSDDARKLLEGAPTVKGSDSAKPSSTPSGGSQAAQTSAAEGWEQLIDPATLEDEIKGQVASIEAALKSPSDFKGGGFKGARVSFSYLAAMFGVIDRFESNVRWKKDAAALAATFARVGKNCKVGADSVFKESKLREEALRELIRGGNPELLDPLPTNAWAEIADRPPLMARMDALLTQRLKPRTGSKSEFEKNQSANLADAQALAVLSRIIQDASYEYGDDDAYVGFAKELERQSIELTNATKERQLEKAQSAVGQLMQTCTKCHEDYRGG